METLAVTWGTRAIAAEVIRRPRRRTVAISVVPRKGVEVLAPPGVPVSHLEEILLEKGEWICRRLDALAELLGDARPREFVSGEEFLLLGRQLRLKVMTGKHRWPRARQERRRLVADLPERTEPDAQSATVRRALERWYREQAQAEFGKRIAKWSGRLGITPPPFMVKDQQKRWGSCSRSGTIRLNWRLVMAPSLLVDYVVAHELCHLAHHNHSKAFWDLLLSLMPDARARDARLSREGPRFRLE